MRYALIRWSSSAKRGTPIVWNVYDSLPRAKAAQRRCERSHPEKFTFAITPVYIN